MNNRSVLLASNYNVWREPFNGQAQGFLNVVAGVENADLLAPAGASYLNGHGVRPSLRFLLGEVSHRLLSQVKLAVGRPGRSNMTPVKIDKDYDLFFFMCQFPHELAALELMKGWRKRSKVAICYILETWSSSLHEVRSNLKLLDRFDEVFVLNAQSIPELKRYTKTKISFLAPAVDCTLATPLPGCPARTVDVYSFGRRAPAIHEQLIRLARSRGDFHYVYDSLCGGAVIDWSDHRFLTASMIKRSRYFLAFNPGDVGAGGKGPWKDQQALSTRYFEGAAGGAVILGTSPRCEEYAQAFDWPDALIRLDPKDDIDALMRELEKDPERLVTASQRNAAECLRRHDWSHRWAEILGRLGLERTSLLDDRLARLRQLAETSCP